MSGDTGGDVTTGDAIPGVGSAGGATAPRAESAPASERAPAWSRASRPRLPSKVRLQWDDARSQAILLFPEGVLMLNPTAHAVLKLVDGRRTVGEIAGELARTFDPTAAARAEAESVDLSMDPGTDTGEHQDVSGAAAGAPSAEQLAERVAVIERDVSDFLRNLEARGWLLRERPENE